MCNSAEIGIDSLDLSLKARASSLIRHTGGSGLCSERGSELEKER
jgi:hypothetical protein